MVLFRKNTKYYQFVYDRITELIFLKSYLYQNNFYLVSINFYLKYFYISFHIISEKMQFVKIFTYICYF